MTDQEFDALIAECKEIARQAWERQARGMSSDDDWTNYSTCQEVFILNDKAVWC
jgi:hypothetical protein